MAALVLLFTCLLLGVLARRFGSPPAGTVAAVNWWVIRIALPALVLQLVPGLSADPRLWFPVATMWITFFGAWALFGTLGPRLGWSKERVGTLVLVAGLGNTSFMGYPMIEAMRGESGLAVAVVADQLGSFPLLASVGVVVATAYAGGTADPVALVRRIATFPPFLALVVGVIVGVLGGWPDGVDDVLGPIGRTLTPLALFSVGLQLELRAGPGELVAVSLGLVWKLVVAPLAGWALGRAAGVDGPPLAVGVLQAGMAPMISAAILADEHGLDRSLGHTLLGTGIVLSLLTVPVLDALLG